MATSATAKELAENVTQAAITEIKFKTLTPGETFERITAAIPAAVRTTHAGMAELVVSLTFLGVLQNLVGLTGFFELRLVTTILIGMVFHGKLTERLLDLVSAGVFAYS